VKVVGRRERRLAAGQNFIQPRSSFVQRSVPRSLHPPLRGRCFNCFASSHRAAACRSIVRCFHCRLPGHRFRVCPRRATAPARPQRVLVWRPVSKGPSVSPVPLSPCRAMEVVPLSDGPSAVEKAMKRTRRGQRKRKNGADAGGASGLRSVEPPVESAHNVCVLKRSGRIDRAEEGLHRALILTVVGEEGHGCALEIRDALALKFQLQAESLHLRRAAPNSFLCFFPSVEVADQIIQNGQSFFAPPFRLHVRRWSRHAFASGGGALPVLVDIELQGIPAHLWDLETAELLLGAHGLVQGLSTVSSEGVDFADMTAFSVSFWCFSLESLPDVLFLHAVEPRVNVEVGSWFPRTMVFKIAVKVIRSGDMIGADQLPPLLPDCGGDDGDRDNHRRRPPMHYHPSPSARVSALSRLGPRVSSAVAGGGPVDATSPLMVGVERMAPGSTLPSDLVVSSPVDAHSLPVLAVDEVVAPGSPDSTAQDVEWDPVDAHSLPLISDDGMMAPGALVGTVDSGPVVQLGSLVLSMAAAPSGSVIQVTEVLSGSVNVNAQFGVSVKRNIWTVEPLNRMSLFLLSKMIHGGNDASPCLKVYSRRKKLVLEPVQDEECVLSSQLQEFKNDITDPINSLLPPPQITNRRRTVPANFIPRRSRRVAKFPPELGSSSAAQVCRQLGFCDEMENISLEDANGYARLFKNGLFGSHVAALFGWQVPLVGHC
jgi:hypothetical protein